MDFFSCNIPLSFGLTTSFSNVKIELSAVLFLGRYFKVIWKIYFEYWWNLPKNLYFTWNTVNKYPKLASPNERFQTGRYFGGRVCLTQNTSPMNSFKHIYVHCLIQSIKTPREEALQRRKSRAQGEMCLRGEVEVSGNIDPSLHAWRMLGFC